MRNRGPRVTVAAAHAYSHETTTQVFHLVELLADHGYQVEVALVRGGDRLRELRRLVRVDVADKYRSRGFGGLLTLLGRDREAMAYRSWRVRRSTRAPITQPWIVCDTEAAWFLRLHDQRPPALVVHLADPRSQMSATSSGDLMDLTAADMWLTVTESQSAELRMSSTVTGDVVLVGDLWEPQSNIPLPPATGGVAPVVLSPPSGTWLAVSHTVEIVAQLHRKAPDIPLLWLADPGEDEWLARHDLAHLGLDRCESVTTVERASALSIRPSMIVRTGYVASDPDLVLAAALEQVPTIGFNLGDLPASVVTETAPFAVEDLVEQILRLQDHNERWECGASLAAAVRRRDDPQDRLRPLYAFLESLQGPRPSGQRDVGGAAGQ